MITLISGFFIAIMTYINIGFNEAFFSTWAKSLFYAVIVMALFGGGIMFLWDKTAKMLLPNLKTIMQNVLIGILMALSMEAIMAVSTALNIEAFHNLEQFTALWLKSYIAALPFALVFAPVMAVFIKPKLEAYLAR